MNWRASGQGLNRLRPRVSRFIILLMYALSASKTGQELKRSEINEYSSVSMLEQDRKAYSLVIVAGQ